MIHKPTIVPMLAVVVMQRLRLQIYVEPDDTKKEAGLVRPAGGFKRSGSVEASCRGDLLGSSVPGVCV